MNEEDSMIVTLKRPEPPEPQRPRKAPEKKSVRHNDPPPPEEPPKEEKPRRRRKRFPWRYIIIGILFWVLLGAGVYLYFQGENLALPEISLGSLGVNSDVGEPESPEEVADLIDKVSQLIVLPEGETPTVATVSDPEKLRDQPFFANAEIGHKVLLYTAARKAYLYDPVEDKLIEVAPITTDIE